MLNDKIGIHQLTIKEIIETPELDQLLEPFTIDVETVDTSISGFYYVTYTNSTFKYKNVVLIRTIQVMEVENNG